MKSIRIDSHAHQKTWESDKLGIEFWGQFIKPVLILIAIFALLSLINNFAP